MTERRGPTLALCEALVRRACRVVPEEMCDEQLMEWLGELPIILGDPDIRWSWCRRMRVIQFSVGTFVAASQTRRYAPENKLLAMVAYLVGYQMGYMDAHDNATSGKATPSRWVQWHRKRYALVVARTTIAPSISALALVVIATRMRFHAVFLGRTQRDVLKSALQKAISRAVEQQ